MAKHFLPNSLFSQEDWDLIVLSYFATMLVVVLAYFVLVRG